MGNPGLTILGGDADVDNYLQQTRSNIQDIEAAVIELKAKAMRHKFEDTFINGDTASDANAFDGLDELIDTGTASSQVIAMAATGGTLTLEKLDELIDAVKGGKPDLLLTSRRSRRKLTSLMRALGSIEVGQDELGNFVQLYNGIMVAVNDWIADTQVLTGSVVTADTGSACSTIYALSLGEGAVCGLQNKGIQADRIGELETKDATRTRLKWYISLADFSVVKRAALIGVKD